MGTGSVGLTMVQVAHLHQGLWLGRGAHNFMAICRSMIASVPTQTTEKCALNA